MSGHSGSVESLNAAHREAVEYTGGPLIVLAGPGTGKTRVITHRVEHMIRERGIEPERISLTTFSVRAAEEMRARLVGLLGESVAARVNAQTTHGFGMGLLRRFADRLDLPPLRGARSARDAGWSDGGGGGAEARSGRRLSSEIIDAAQSRRMLRRLIVDEDLFQHARAGGLESIVAEAESVFAYFGQLGLGPSEVDAGIARWRERLVAAADAEGGQRQQVERASQYARLYRLFEAERRASGLLTYDDLILLPIRLLREHEDVRAWCRSEYSHWLVDEFQDVNRAQIELLRLVAPPESAAGNRPRDLCIVGDDDQAIYGFRGADHRAFATFNAIWPRAKVISLTENHRSRPRLIDIANSITSGAVDRFAPEKTTVFPASKDRQPPGIVQCVGLKREFEDAEAIGAMIRAEVGSGDPGGDGKPYARYAVVARTHGDLDRVQDALFLEGIPTLRWGTREDPENEPGVRDLLAWARLIAHPREGWHARRLLLRPPVCLPPERVNDLMFRYRGDASRYRAVLEADPDERSALVGAGRVEDPGEFAAWVRRCAGEHPAIRRFCDWYDEFASLALQESAADVLMRIAGAVDIVHADLLDASRRARRAEAIVSFLTFAQARQARLQQPGGLRDFLEYYEDLPAADRSRKGRPGESDIDAPQTDADPEEINAVRLLTAHASKGLEFDTVFVPRVHPSNGYPKTKGGRDESGMVADLRAGGIFEDQASSTRDRALAEERRVFYVACTRAKRRLVLLATTIRGKSSSTHFVQELLRDAKVASSIEVIGIDDLLAHAGKGVRPPRVEPVGSLVEYQGGSSEVDHRLRDRRREMFERARSEVRLLAAGALCMADAPPPPGGSANGGSGAGGGIEGSRRILAESADLMAAIAALEGGPDAPVGTTAFSDAGRAIIDRLAGEVRRLREPAAGVPDGGSAWAQRRARPPLELSYTAIDTYLRCPRCYYVRYMLGHEGPPGHPADIGAAVHRALQRFYDEFRSADSSGAGAPGVQRMLALAREEFIATTGSDEEVDRGALDRVLAQVRLGYQRLHAPDIHVLETEHPIRFAYRCGDHTHGLTAKIDRIDQVTFPDGTTGLRIVDYKTGHASKKYLEPRDDDLQMGLYVLAVRSEYGPEIRGTAEYWVLSNGSRGAVDFERIDQAAVRDVIDRVIEGILAGRFERGKDCKEPLCEILDPPV